MMKSWINAAPYLQVALGGALGAAARLGVNRAALAAFGPGLPLGTLAVNVAGSFLMGVLFVALAGRGDSMAPFLLTGVLGGFTTFSSFSLDTVVLWERGAQALAVGNVVASVMLSVLALVAGLAVARGIWA